MKSAGIRSTEDKSINKAALLAELETIKSSNEVKDPERINHIYKQLIKATDTLSINETEKLFITIAEINLFDLQLLNLLASRLSDVPIITPDQINKFVSAMSKLGYQNNQFLDYIKTQISLNISSFTPEARINLLNDLSKLGLDYFGSEKREQWARIIEEIIVADQTILFQELKNIKKLCTYATAIAKLDFYSESFCQCFQIYLHENISQADAVDLAKTITYIAKANLPSQEFIELVLGHFEQKLNNASNQSKVNSLYYTLMFKKNNEELLSAEFKNKINQFLFNVLENIDYSRIIRTEAKNQLLCVINEIATLPGKGALNLPSPELIKAWKHSVHANNQIIVSKIQNRVSNYLRYVANIDVQNEKWLDESNSSVDCYIPFDSDNAIKKGLVIQVDGPTHYMLNNYNQNNSNTIFNTKLLSKNYEILRINYQDIESGAYKSLIQAKLSNCQPFLRAQQKEQSVINRYSLLADEELENLELEEHVSLNIPIATEQKVKHKKKVTEDEDFDKMLEEFKVESAKIVEERKFLDIPVFKKAINDANLAYIKESLTHCRKMLNKEELSNFISNGGNDSLINLAAQLLESTISRVVMEARDRQIEADKELEKNQIINEKTKEVYREATRCAGNLISYYNHPDIKQKGEIFQKLYHEGIIINRSNAKRFIGFAVVLHDFDMLNKMLKQFKINYEHDHELINDMFIGAAKVNNLEAIKILSKKFTELDPNITDLGGFTALHHAATNGFDDIAEFLLVNCRVNPNTFAKQETIAEEHNITPLYAAVSCSNTFSDGDIEIQENERKYKRISELLIEFGADYNIKSKNGDNLFAFAIRGGCTEVIKKIISDGIINISKVSCSLIALGQMNSVNYANNLKQFEVKEILEEALNSKYKKVEPTITNRLESLRFSAQEAYQDKDLLSSTPKPPESERPKNPSDRYRKKFAKSSYTEKVVDQKNQENIGGRGYS